MNRSEKAEAIAELNQTFKDATLVVITRQSGLTVQEVTDLRRKTIPALRFGTPEEFGATCAFLCSVHASYITGQNVLIDGGAYPGTY